MQTNTRLVQNISHAYKSGTNLGCKSDSLCFSTG